MSEQSAIEWTDATWNPVRGCTKVSPGCANCYAETFAERWRGVKGHPYEQGFDLRLVPEKLDEPLHWKKPRRIFVNSMSDLFQDGVPDEFIDQVFAVMALCPQHTFQVLTKRAERMREYFDRLQFEPERLEDAATDIAHDDIANTAWLQNLADEATWPLKKVLLGVSVENQHFADERIPLLLQTPAAVRFISAEPLLGPVHLDNGESSWLSCNERCDDQTENPCLSYLEHDRCFRGLDWVIVGGESGHGARPFHLAWARAIVAQCKAAGVACFVKQLGSYACDIARPHHVTDAERAAWIREGWCRVITDDGEFFTKHPRLSDRKGGDVNEWPEDLRVREFPAVRA